MESQIIVNDMKKFVIVAPSRSGSTLVRTMLNRHPEICCHGEVYGMKRVLGQSKHALNPLDPELALKLRQRDPVKFLHAQVFTSQRPTVGFKLLYSQILQMDFSPVLQQLIEMPDLRVVFLWRRDLIARYVSEVRLRIKAAQRNIPKGTGVTLENALRPALVERACRINIAGRACAEQIFARQSSIAIVYEDFIADHQTQSARLCNFLSVDPRGCLHYPKRATIQLMLKLIG